MVSDRLAKKFTPQQAAETQALIDMSNESGGKLPSPNAESTREMNKRAQSIMSDTDKLQFAEMSYHENREYLTSLGRGW